MVDVSVYKVGVIVSLEDIAGKKEARLLGRAKSILVMAKK